MSGCVDPEMCLLLVMHMECSKEKRCFGSPASLFNSRTVVVPIHSPFFHFPQFMTISSWSDMSGPSVQIQDTLPIFSHSSLTTLWLSSVCIILSSGKDEPFLLCCTHLQASRNMWWGSTMPSALTGFPARTGVCPPGASAQDCWSPQGWKTEAGNLNCLLN